MELSCGQVETRERLLRNHEELVIQLHANKPFHVSKKGEEWSLFGERPGLQ
jgi:hypothetical protein